MHPGLKAELQANEGLISRRSHPELVQAIKRAHGAGELVRVLSGSYLAAEVAGSLTHRIRALVEHDPDAVITGAAAAHLSWWPELAASEIDAYRRGRCARANGFRWHGYRPNSELVSSGLATPALQVLDLMAEVGSRAVDEALRRRATTLTALHRALDLTPDRPHNNLRRLILADSRDEPWSPAEREFHRVLREARITGWKTNHRLTIDGHSYHLDVAFPRLRLAFEVDGFEFHSARTAFENDRARDARLASKGWQVVRISAAQVPGSARVVKAVIAARVTLLRHH